MEQPQYNLLSRKRFEDEYAPLYKELGYGTTTYSPLYTGILTGKYLNGIPEDSRATLDDYPWFKKRAEDSELLALTKQLLEVAEDLGVTMAQMSLAWILKNPNVSTVITGASKVSQLEENLKATEIKGKLTDDVMERIREIVKDFEG